MTQHTHNYNSKTEGYYNTQRTNRAVLTATDYEVMLYEATVRDMI